MPQSEQPPKSAIRLGPSKWIEHIDLTGRYASAIDIDLMLIELEPMWSALETECVADCCGIDAFDFSPDAILAAAAKMACAADLCPTLARLRKTLRDLPTDAFVSTRLNNYSDREVFDALLGHLESHFQAAAESQLRSSAPGDA